MMGEGGVERVGKGGGEIGDGEGRIGGWWMRRRERDCEGGGWEDVGMDCMNEGLWNWMIEGEGNWGVVGLMIGVWI